MKLTNRETMLRAIGIIEGVSFGAGSRVQDALALACELLDSVLNDEEEDGESNRRT